MSEGCMYLHPVNWMRPFCIWSKSGKVAFWVDAIFSSALPCAAELDILSFTLALSWNKSISTIDPISQYMFGLLRHFYDLLANHRNGYSDGHSRWNVVETVSSILICNQILWGWKPAGRRNINWFSSIQVHMTFCDKILIKWKLMWEVVIWFISDKNVIDDQTDEHDLRHAHINMITKKTTFNGNAALFIVELYKRFLF